MRLQFDFGHLVIHCWHRKAFLYSTTCALIMTGCGLEKPKAPVWAVDMRVPLASRHIDGPYLAAHAGSEYLRWQDDSGLVWGITANLDTVTLAGKLTTTPPTASATFPLGAITIGEGTTLSHSIALSEVTPLSAGLVPALSTELEASFPQAATFDSVSGASGLLHIEIENQLGVTVEQVIVTLYAQAAAPIAVLTIPGPIPSSDAQSADYPLSDIAASNDWHFTLAFHTPGGTVLSAADKFIAVHTSFPEGITATFARAAVNPLSRQFVDSLVLSDTHQLSGAVIASGELMIDWVNRTPLPVAVSWQVPDLTIDGASFSGQATFAPGDSASLPIDLAGAQFTGGGESSTVAVEVTVESSGSDGGTVEISSTQTVGYELTWSELTLASASGKVATTQFSTGTLAASIEWDDGLEAAGLDNWGAFLIVTSSLPMPAQLSGTVTSNTGLHFIVNASVASAGASPVTVRIPLNGGSEPLHPLPGEVQFSGTVMFGGGSESVEVSSTDFINAAVELSAPPHIYVDGVSLDIEPSSIAISSDDYGDRTGRLLDATVTITVANRFPLGGQFTLRVAGDSIGVMGSDALVFGPSTLMPAATDEIGNAVSATTTELTYSLDSAGLALFEGEIVWFAESLSLLGPGNGQPARISAADVLDWHAQAVIEVKVDGDVRPWEE